MDRTLKSVHITNYYHKNSGGIGTAYDRLLEAANRHQRFVRLIVPGESDKIEEVGKYGRIYYVRAANSPLFDKRYRILLPWKSYIFDKSPIKRILREEQPDLIEIGEKYTLSLMGGLLRKGTMSVSPDRPILVHFSCERMDDNIRAFISDRKIGKWFARRLVGNYIFPMFDFHLANSGYTAQEFVDAISPEQNPRRSNRFFNLCWRFFRAPQVPAGERLFVNQCGADVLHFRIERKSVEKRRQILVDAGFPEIATVLLYAGRLSPEKNVWLLPALMKSLSEPDVTNPPHREYRLLIAGDGPQAGPLRAELESLAPGRYKFLGHISDKEKLADIYANTDVFVHPNPREPFGIAPLEAMASGLPVVAPNAGGVLSYATNENAWLAEPEADDFSAAVRDVFANDERRAVKTRNALETARQFTWENSTDRLFSLYDKMSRDFLSRRELYDYSSSPKRIDFASGFIGELNKFSPAGLALVIRCCNTRLLALACIAYFFAVFASIAIVWGRRFLGNSSVL